ncbi:cellulose synthase (UDP-forming) [Clostridium acetobutylicum]|uniref:Glycosyltransferases, involved in cell wall biogenesis n=1 Tax=Clostridium acetobutylicum (strain ATCC 824 / DSM 792 / JCM 1419 / IAM 19013 / LMG 5710 / NBRC 13948 / NRRL B-527 / VKM B-1787 / 2291 / W) TaxID=272562 RepID=Q97IS9_CLOAB|nr:MULTISPECIES: glycosyltransferase [Clostridium]AAK79528.1 Glycosyltransferases, involved in cell wall biogenesis [Clostridium acetobutylicum ATCC 824]ADZ20613.1 Glycosyltransferase [Clostridium acetobutylicum EA 2018]AEI33806.1 cell wall biosynthesis glycosyltransferase [Clostridium acetobutylicum DSM 1731]AWV81228.1 glycosyltransferase [Clostridium acetobutylicum]KHD36300.1 glycosyl transferase [Clostridium acetobutylicum]
MKLKKHKSNEKLLICCTVIFTIIYLVWRITCTLPLGGTIVSLVAAIILLVVEIMGVFEAAVHFYNMSNIEQPERPKVSEDLFPDVDVFIATYNEPRELLYKTINGCINMDYPDKKKVHIYLCDDGNRDEMKELADYMGINYITRIERKGSKAGNLNNAMAHSKSPLIATFDADMIPMHDFLMACVPYFLTEEKVGFIQTPQSFYNPDLFQYNLFSENRIPNEQDYFYRDIQVARNKTNSVIYGGTNTLISRKALNDVGGFYTDAITEDFATGIYIESKGYHCYAIDEIHASGLAPEDLKGLVKQRERWARGCIQTGKRLNILGIKGLNLKQKLNYLSSISYWFSGIKRFVYILSPILFSVFGVIVVKCNLPQVLIFWLPMYLLTNASLKRLSKNIRTNKWTSIYDTILFPSLIIPVILETIGISQNKFAVTRKGGAVSDKSYQRKKAIPHIILAVLSVIGIINCFRLIFAKNTLAYAVVLFWLVANLYNILMSVFFMLGRTPHRKSERASVSIDCSINKNGKEVKGVTKDISEGGVSVVLDEPIDLYEDNSVGIQLLTDRYSCNFEAEVVHVDKVQDKWKYAFKTTGIEENDFRQLLYIIYDRVPVLPKHISKSNSIFDDIRLNVLTRGKKVNQFNRKHPRLEIRKKLQSEECGEVEIINFNYEYALVKTDSEYNNIKHINISILPEVTIKCSLDKKMDYETNKKKKNKPVEQSIQLYRIDNYSEISEITELQTTLNKWANEYEAIKKIENKKKKKAGPSDELNEMAYL